MVEDENCLAQGSSTGIVAQVDSGLAGSVKDVLQCDESRPKPMGPS